jgi:hypothetical protein
MAATAIIWMYPARRTDTSQHVCKGRLDPNHRHWRKAVFRQLSDVRNTDLLPVMLDATFVCVMFSWKLK